MQPPRTPIIITPPHKSIPPEPSSLAMHLKDCFSKAYEQSIFTAENKADRELYVTRRYDPLHRISRVSAPPLALENLMHEVFWNRQQYPQSIIFLVGHVGTGKSTLLKYYLFDHCTEKCADDDFLKSEFPRKCIIFIDLLHTTKSDLQRVLFATIRKQIICFLETYGIDIHSAFDFAFWRPKVMVSGSLFASKTIEEKKDYVINALLPNIGDAEWVDMALSFLSGIHKSESTFPLRYLVLTLDNTDQTGYSLLRECIEHIHRWINSKAPFWRIIIPVWHSIFERLERDFNPMPPSYAIYMRMTDNDELFSKRTTILQREVEQKAKHNSSAFKKILEDCDLRQENLDDYIGYARKAAKGMFSDFIAQSAGDSTSRLLALWHETLTSDSISQHFRNIVSSGNISATTLENSAFRRVGAYAWFDAAITGRSRYHNKWSSPFPNVLYTLENQQDAHDSLVGLFIVHLIARHSLRTVSDLALTLDVFGFAPTLINKSMQYLYSKHFFQWVDDKLDEFIVFPGISDSWMTLIESAAYIDNIAQTTPLLNSRPTYSVAAQGGTVSWDTAHFVPRACNTLALLEQVREDEDQIQMFLAEKFSEKDLFIRKLLRKYRFPRISKMMASTMFERWNFFYTQRDSTYLKSITPAEWAVLTNPILQSKFGSLSDWIDLPSA